MNSEYNFCEARVEWDERHAILLKDFLEAMVAQGIRYVILKNDGGLPYQNHSKDVDIVIEPGKYCQAARVIKECYKRHGVSHCKIHQFERLRCWYGMNPDTHFAIHIDLLEGFLHKGFEMFPFEVLHKHSVKNDNGVQVLDKLTGNVVLLLHSTICYHSIKEKYAKSIANAYSHQQQEFTALLLEILGRKGTYEMIRLLDANDYKEIAKRGRHFSHQSKWRLLTKRPFLSIYNVANFVWEKVCRLLLNLNRYNTMISVHAPDGTGKTTFIEHLGNELGFYYACAANDLLVTYHFRPCILPNLGAAGEKSGIMKQDKNFTVPHRAKPVNPLSSLIRMTYYWLDYAIGVPLILRKNAQFSKITIFDRYIYDFITDPERTRIGLPYWVRNIFVKLTKKPNVIFILYADAGTIHSRKQELTFEEINHQLVILKKLSHSGSRFKMLDATRTPPEIAHQALKIILDATTQRL